MIESSTTFSLLPKVPWSGEPVPDVLTGSLEPAAVYRSGFRTDCRVDVISQTGATLRGALAAKPGDALALELATGQRPAATLAWVTPTAFGVEFKQPIDVLALINRNLVSQPVERRKMPRIEMRCVGWLKHNEAMFSVTVRNISARGLQVEADELPPPGSEVLIYLEGLNLPPGEILWKHHGRAGIELHSEVSWALIIRWLRALASASSD